MSINTLSPRQAAGRNAETIKEASLAVIRWCLNLFLSVVSAMARNATYQSMYLPLVM